jgi:hypothetical protein
MIRLLLLSAIALSLASCASAPPTGLSLEYTGHIGIVPYRLAYQGGKATVAISTPWRRIRPDNFK